MPPDKVEVDVVAALIIRAQAQDTATNRESTMKPHLPLSIGLRLFVKPTNVSPIARIRVPTMVWGREASAERCQQRLPQLMLTLLLLSRCHAARLKSPATKSTFASGINARIVRMSFFLCHVSRYLLLSGAPKVRGFVISTLWPHPLASTPSAPTSTAPSASSPSFLPPPSFSTTHPERPPPRSSSWPQ